MANASANGAVELEELAGLRSAGALTTRGTVVAGTETRGSMFAGPG